MGPPEHFAREETEKIITRQLTIAGIGLAVLLLAGCGATEELRQQPAASSDPTTALTLEEYPIVSADVDTPSRFEFLDRIPSDILARREVWRGFDAVRRVSTLNETLAPFGYRLVAENNAGSWILEVDGESLTEQLKVDEIFHYVIFQGQPLFFFEQGGQVGISHGGETLPYTYDEVVHYQCCEPAMFNIVSNEHMLWFYALKDEMWHYVEMGVYDE
jgi:hypothetical protein